MRVQIGVVEAGVSGPLLVGARLQLVVDRNFQPLPRRYPDGWSDEIARLLAGPDEGAKLDLVVAQRPRVVQRPLCSPDLEMILEHRRRGGARQHCGNQDSHRRPLAPGETPTGRSRLRPITNPYKPPLHFALGSGYRAAP